MLGPYWHKVLILFLWVTPHVLLAVAAAIIWKRRLDRQYPCFFAYVLFRIATFILLFTLYCIESVQGPHYKCAFAVTLLCIIALSFGVIDEVSRHLFRESRFLKVSARRLLQCVAGLLLPVGVVLAIYAPGNNTIWWQACISAINRGAAMVQCGLLLSLFLLSRFLGLSWRRLAFGITLGFGILACVDLAASALRTEFTSNAARDLLNLLTMSTYLVCVLIWLRYLVASEAEAAPPPVLPPNNEVEIWNKALQQFLNH